MYEELFLCPCDLSVGERCLFQVRMWVLPSPCPRCMSVKSAFSRFRVWGVASSPCPRCMSVGERCYFRGPCAVVQNCSLRLTALAHRMLVRSTLSVVFRLVPLLRSSHTLCTYHMFVHLLCGRCLCYFKCGVLGLKLCEHLYRSLYFLFDWTPGTWRDCRPFSEAKAALPSLSLCTGHCQSCSQAFCGCAVPSLFVYLHFPGHLFILREVPLHISLPIFMWLSSYYYLIGTLCVF